MNDFGIVMNLKGNHPTIKKCSAGIFRISYCVNRPGVKRSSATEQ